MAANLKIEAYENFQYSNPLPDDPELRRPNFYAMQNYGER
jgi:hypothetical protein